MSSVPRQQQHLITADMNASMQASAHAMRSRPGASTAKCVAALLVSEFQHCVSEEARVLTTFTADRALKLSIPVSRIGTFMARWEAGSGTAARTPSLRPHIEATA